MYVLYGERGWGSALIEAQLAWYGLSHRIEEVGNLFRSAEARAKIAPWNPLGQIPVLVLPNGAVMTESAAITIHLAESARGEALAPAPGDPDRPAFLRWLVFLVANIYPTFTYADEPKRFAPEAASEAFRVNVEAYGERLWRMVETQAGGPWFLGARLSALDIYLGVMTRWRPGPAWFTEQTPRIAAIATRVHAEPRLASVFRRNYPEQTG